MDLHSKFIACIFAIVVLVVISAGLDSADAAPVDKNDRAMNIKVHMIVNGKMHSFDTFTKFDHSLSSMPSRGGKFSSSQYFDNPSFMLYSLPSKDKSAYYDHVFGFINSQGNKPPFVDMTIELKIGRAHV